ncbi:unnamed protein product [marine sediment metagenome]|uniref:SpoVT-AbrB domain-containing protein n=1 Tax=marine sediment metagenome TaxID=412755 RepID=X1QIF6_9ZZZZ
MEKQYVRKMQKIGNGLGLRVPPELCQEAEVGRGDNVSLEFNPGSGGLKLGKVAPTNPGLDDVPQQDETLKTSENKSSENKSNENKSNENKSRVDLAGKEAQGQQDEITKIKFCTSCGSDDIQVTGNQFYCGECDVTYEMTPRGTKVVAANPVQIVDDLENRVEQLENDMDKLNGNSDKDKNSNVWFNVLGLFDVGWADGTEDDEDEDKVPVGAVSDDEDEDEPDGFITW